LVPFAALHALDYQKISWKVGGQSRSIIQKAIVRRFLHYEDFVRASVRDSDVLMATLRDAPELVGGGYMNLIALASAINQLLMILAYQLFSPFVYGKPFRPMPVLPFIIFPIFLFQFRMCRINTTMAVLRKETETETEMADCVQDTVENYRLLSAYRRRAAFVARFEKDMNTYNEACGAMAKVFLNNGYFPKWLSIVCVCLYTCVGGLEVIAGEQPLGAFTVNLSIIVKIGDLWGHIYQNIIGMQKTFPAIKNISRLLNKPIDIEHRSRLTNSSNELTRKFRAEIRASGVAGVPLDLMPIKVEGLNFAYGGKLHQSKSTIQQAGEIKINQGQLVAFVGNIGQGKSTILKLLGGSILQNIQEGGHAGIFIPAHLRVLHVSQEAMFFHDTLFKNLTLGVKEGSRDGNIERVIGICKKLELPDHVLTHIYSNEELNFGDVLSETQKILLNLARAFIANFEVTCIHKPTQSFGAITSDNVVKLLKEHVTSKGLIQNPATVDLRRPRTVFFSSTKVAGVELAESVYHVSTADGVRAVGKDKITPEMLA
jgi:ABC-type multidrug transport system fused ATPase/permease subunit